MRELVSWFFSDGTQLVESAGIIIGLFFTGFALRADARSRQADILIRLTEGHRALWTYQESRPELKRIFSPDVDIATAPLTPQEARFVQFFINHVVISYRARKLGLYATPEQLESDLREFFSRPVPLAAWQKLRRYQDGDFARYIDALIPRRQP